MAMRTLQEQLIEKGLSKRPGQETDRKNTKPKDKRIEHLTSRDLAELMGVRRDIYKRVGGAIRRR